MHHTQLLNRLVRDGRLTPVASGEGAAQRSITYHDPCFLGRHNQVYSPPRELLQVLPGASYVEMERSAERSFCCGAGGARMWMEERIGERINENRTREAVATGADQIAVGCPFCRVMLDDGLTAAQSKGEARDEVEVLDVAQMLLASVKGVSATRAPAVVGAGPGPSAPPAASSVVEPASAASGVETPEAKESTPTGGSLFDDATSLFGDQEDKPQPTEAKSEVEATKGAEGKTGGSLFGDGASLFDTPVQEETKYKDEPESARDEKPTDSKADTRTDGSTGLIPEGTSLFDVGDAGPEAKAQPAPTPVEAVETKADKPEPALGSTIPEGESLFDIGEPEAEPEPAPVETTSDQAPGWKVGDDIPEGQSLFDVGGRPDPVEISRLATAAASGDPQTILDADDEPDDEPDDDLQGEPEDKPRPPASGTTNTPRADADINQAGSLFDL